MSSPANTEPRVVTLEVNGAPRSATVRPYDVLLDVLREELNLTGTKRGCDMGTCGCCAVLLDGRPRLSCLTLALDCVEKQVTTIEGLRPGAGARFGAAILRRDRRLAVRVLHARASSSPPARSSMRTPSPTKRRSARRSPATSAGARGT